MNGDAPGPDGGAYAAWLAEIERALDAAHREAAPPASDDATSVTSRG